MSFFLSVVLSWFISFVMCFLCLLCLLCLVLCLCAFHDFLSVFLSFVQSFFLFVCLFVFRSFFPHSLRASRRARAWSLEFPTRIFKLSTLARLRLYSHGATNMALHPLQTWTFYILRDLVFIDTNFVVCRGYRGCPRGLRAPIWFVGRVPFWSHLGSSWINA